MPDAIPAASAAGSRAESCARARSHCCCRTSSSAVSSPRSASRAGSSEATGLSSGQTSTLPYTHAYTPTSVSDAWHNGSCPAAAATHRWATKHHTQLLPWVWHSPQEAAAGQLQGPSAPLLLLLVRPSTGTDMSSSKVEGSSGSIMGHLLTRAPDWPLAAAAHGGAITALVPCGGMSLAEP